MWQNSVDLPVDEHIKLSVNVRLFLTDFDRNGNGQTKLSNIRLHQIYVAVPKLFHKDRKWDGNGPRRKAHLLQIFPS